MYNVPLSKRLKEIADVVPKSQVVADIGCDHGKVLYRLLSLGKAQYGIGSDISKLCVDKTRALLSDAGFNNFDIRVADGFDGIRQEDQVNTVIIAGMGGMEIVHILECASFKFDTYILQPMSDIPVLRKYLNEHDYKIEYDRMMCDRHKYYTIMKVVMGTQNLNDLEILFGKDNFDNLVFKDYLENEINKTKEYLGLVQNGNRDELETRLEMYMKAYKIGESKWKNC